MTAREKAEIATKALGNDTIPLLKRIVSYLFPINLRKYESPVSGILEINLVNGKKVLDTGNSNYSYGLLQQVLHSAIDKIEFDAKIKNILVLGMGGGSIVSTVREYFSSEATITLVDIDETVISIAKNEFGIDLYPNVEIIQNDALVFVENCSRKFDLIIVDLFVGNKIPEVFLKEPFIGNLTNCLPMEGKLIFNTLQNTLNKSGFEKLTFDFAQHGIHVVSSGFPGTANNLILGKKTGGNSKLL